MTVESRFADFQIVYQPCADLTAAQRDVMLALFRSNYREANAGYLESSLGKLKYCAIATLGDEPAGFALAELRVMDLPRLPAQHVALAGICCVAPQFRRRRLFGALEHHALIAAPDQPKGRWLNAGRAAHPASLRVARRGISMVPRPGAVPTPWQQAVGATIAGAYGAPAFDPATFVCAGSGKPVGYPVIEIDATPEEWEQFRHVDRDRGDSLLVLSWLPDAPTGWDDDRRPVPRAS